MDTVLKDDSRDFAGIGDDRIARDWFRGLCSDAAGAGCKGTDHDAASEPALR